MTMPVYLHRNRTTTGTGEVIDITAAYQERLPPVLHVKATGTLTYTIEGSHDGTDWHVYYTGSASVKKDLVVGVALWRCPATITSGSITASVGSVPDKNGSNVSPRIVVANSVPVP